MKPKSVFKRSFSLFINFLVIISGSIIAGVGLEFFLVPNHILDGGVVGLSIIASHLTGVELSIFLVILNIPFLFLAYQRLGKMTAIKSFVGIIGLALTTHFLHHSEPFTQDLLLATVFGGLMLGVGIGLVVKIGGALDGSEIFSIFLNGKTNKSVAQILLYINIGVFGIAGFVFGWEQAMYSILTFYIAFKMIDIVLDGLDETKNAWIISDKPNEISDAIIADLGRGVTFIKGEGAYSQDEKRIIFCVFSRIEENKLKEIVLNIDPNAFLAVSNIHEVHGRSFDSKKAH
jgi:uncharacterized membrane-anchored protein YitT (DUF2179 family)